MQPLRRERPPLVAIVGATATGKSDLAMDLAEVLGGEIINADALQLYRGMDVGTAKVPVAERRGIPHHLLDVLEVTQEASVSAYQGAARRAIRSVRARGKVPIVVGGSGLYIRAVLDDISFPPTDPGVRGALEAEMREVGPQQMHRHLAGIDPAAARRIGINDERRIIRALEVQRLTGEPFTAFLPRPVYRDPASIQIGLRAPREQLHERVAQRVDHMVELGLLEEIVALRRNGLDRGPTARRAIGYEQGLAYLDGKMTCAEAIEATVTGTRKLIRKQDTWFRRDSRVHWVETGARAATDALEVLRQHDPYESSTGGPGLQDGGTL